MGQTVSLPLPGFIVRAVAARWPKEVVVEHNDGTVSLYSGFAGENDVIRARRAGDIIREDG
jgi:hypothetical protein